MLRLRKQHCAAIGCGRTSDRRTFGSINYVSAEHRQYCPLLLKPALLDGVVCRAHCRALRRLVDKQRGDQAAPAAALDAALQHAVLIADQIAELLSSPSDSLQQLSPLSSQYAPQSPAAAAIATSSTASLLTATPITVGGTRAPFTSLDSVLQPLYDDSMPHPGLSHCEVSLTDRPQPPLLGELPTAPAPMYSMPVVAFNLPDQSSVQDSVSMAQHNKRKRRRVTVEDVLRPVKEPANGNRRATRRLVKVFYQRDNEGFKAWQREPDLFIHAFNPHSFALHDTNLCLLMRDVEFPGFSSPSWYVKLPNSFFCLHVEQLFAPFYNYCYEGGTTWWVVRREGRARLDNYLVRRAKMESPFLSLIPPVATAPLLQMVGSFLFAEASALPLSSSPTRSVPAFLTIAIIPFTSSIALGISLSLVTWLLLRLATGECWGRAAGQGGQEAEGEEE
jgi:hypothetical protein